MKRIVIGAALAALTFGVFGLTASATDEKYAPPPDHSITVTKEVENGPDDASYVIEVNCTNHSDSVTFGENGGSATITVPNDAGSCNVVETQTNGAVVDIEGNGSCNLPESTWTKSIPATVDDPATKVIEPATPYVPGYWTPATGSSCAFEVSNFFDTPPEVVPPEIIVSPPEIITIPVPVLSTPQFTG